MSANSDEDIERIRLAAEKQAKDTPNITLADGKEVTQVGTVMQKWGDNYSGAAIDPTKWDVTGGANMTIGVAGGALTVGMGTTALARLTLISKAFMVTNPVNLSAILSMSQRIAGNEFRMGLIEVDPDTGVPIIHATLPAEFRNRVAMLLNGTSSTTAALETICESSAIVSKNSTSLNTMAALAEITIEVRPEDVTLTNRVADTVAAKSGSAILINSQIPAMNRAYKVWIDFYNPTAPATNTNVVINRFLALDIQELMVEVGGGRGNTAGSQSIPVYVSNTAFVSGPLAHDVANASTSNPVLMGGAATNISPAAVSANNDAVRAQYDMVGRVICEIGGIPQSQLIYSATVGVNTETTMFTAITLGRNRLSSIWIRNDDTVTHTYTIREGVGGTVFRKITLTAGAEKDVLLPNDGVNNSAVNRAWTIQQDTAQTTSPTLVVATAKTVNT